MFDEESFMKERGLVNEQLVSERFGVCRRTLARKRKQGLTHYTFRRKIYYRLQDVEAFLEKEIKEIGNGPSGITGSDNKINPEPFRESD